MAPAVGTHDPPPYLGSNGGGLRPRPPVATIHSTIRLRLQVPTYSVPRDRRLVARTSLGARFHEEVLEDTLPFVLHFLVFALPRFS